MISEVIAGAPLRSGVAAAEAGILAANDLASDQQGRIVFTDTDNNVIWRLRDGIAEIVAGTGERGFSGDGGPATAAQLSLPTQLRFDGAGNLYFADGGNLRIRKVDTRGIITTVIGNGVPLSYGMDLEGTAASLPINLGFGGFTVDRGGNVYLADEMLGMAARSVRRVDTAGNVKVIAGVMDPDCVNCSDGDGGPATRAHFTYAQYLAVDSAGNLFLSDGSSPSYKLRKVSPNGIIGSIILSDAEMLSGLTADGSGNVYTFTSTYFTGKLQLHRIGPDGSVTSTPAIPPVGRLYTDFQGRVLYRSNSEIRLFSDGSLVATLDLTQHGSPDGTPARETRFASSATPSAHCWPGRRSRAARRSPPTSWHRSRT